MISINISKSIKCNSDKSLFITFPYDAKIVEVIKSLPYKFWNPDNKEWEVPCDKLGTLISQLSNYQFDITGLSLTSETPSIDYEFKTKPFDHQIESFNFALTKDRWFLGDEQGLGKTKQVIDIAVAKKLQRGYKHCLIICGVNGLKWNWVNEIHTHSNEEAHILGQKVKGSRITIGNSKDKLADLTSNLNDLPYFIITNVETLRDESIAAKIGELCENKSIGLVAIDEIHKCKNPSSQQGKGILKVKSECRIAMTGTPLMNNPMDLYIILKWLGYEQHAFYSFKNHYCVMGGFGGYEVVGYKNLDELQGKLNDIMLRRLKADVLDLPEKLYINEYVDMSSKQAQLYKEVTMEIKTNIDQIKLDSNPLAALIRMRQATGFTGILSSTIQESAKLDRMEELVEEAVANGKKVVIFSNWTQMTTPVRERLLKYNPAVITGEINANVRQAMVDKFQNDKSCKVIIGTIGAMGTGLTLTAGTVEIFLDEPWNKALKDQAVDRCHRIGAKENVTIYTIMAKDTIDERIHSIVEEKGAMSDAIVDGVVVSDKKALLEYLVG